MRAKLGPGPLDGVAERLVLECQAEACAVVIGGGTRFGESGGSYSVNVRGVSAGEKSLLLLRLAGALEDTAKQLRQLARELRADG